MKVTAIVNCVTSLSCSLSVTRVKGEHPIQKYYITLKIPPQGEITKTGMHVRLSLQYNLSQGSYLKKQSIKKWARDMFCKRSSRFAETTLYSGGLVLIV